MILSFLFFSLGYFELFVNFAVGDAVPIQLVAPDPTRSELRLRPEALKVLSNIPAPIAVVSIVGAIHSGKSFFLNALRGTSSGFAVGYTVRPETAGLWIWSEPINVEDVNILFLDTEGFYAPNVTESYDAKIYSIATLLSSEIIYNTVKFIDQQALEYLELLTRRANIFGLRAFADHPPADNSSASVSELIGALLPTSLSWVVQDFVQDLQGQTPLHWLEELVENPKTRFVNGVNNSTSQTKSYNEGSTLKNLFTEIDCLALPPPVGNAEELQKLDRVEPSNFSPDYTILLDAYRSRLYSRLSRKVKLRANRTQMAGGDLVSLVTFLVDAANGQRQRFPNVPPVWERFAELQMQYSKTDLLNVYAADTSLATQSQIPLLESESMELHEKVAASILKLFESHISGHSESRPAGPADEIRKSLEIELKQRGIDLLSLTCKRINRHCEVIRDETLKSTDRKLNVILSANCPLGSASLDAKLEQEREESQSHFSDAISIHGTRPYDKSKCCYLDEFKEMLERRFDEARSANERRIDETLRDAVEESQNILTARLSLVDSVDTTPASSWKPEIRAIYQTSEIAFNGIVDSACREAVDIFELAVRPLMTMERGLAARRSLDVIVQEARLRARRRWDEYCTKECARVAEGAVMRLPAHVRRTTPMPCLEEQIEASAMESQKQAELDFRQIHCVDSMGWRTAYGAMIENLNDAIDELRKQNINSIKEMSRVPLEILKKSLIEDAKKHYFWLFFNSLARQQAIEVLKTSSARRNIQTTVPLIEKVADSFVSDDLQGAKDIIDSNLLRSLSLSTGILVLIASAINSIRNRKIFSIFMSVGTIFILLIPATRPVSDYFVYLEFLVLHIVAFCFGSPLNALLWWSVVVCILFAQGYLLYSATNPKAKIQIAEPSRPANDRLYRPPFDSGVRPRTSYQFRG